MIIEEADFTLKPINDVSPLFDLELLRVVNKGKDSQREEFKLEAYGIPMEAALKKVAHYRACKKFGSKDTITLKAYIEAFCEAQQELTRIVNG